MTMELILDPNIRLWVFVPIFLISVLVGILRNYIIIMMSNEPQTNMTQIKAGHAIKRAHLLRQYGRVIPLAAFGMRKDYLNNPKTGYFKLAQNPTVQQTTTNLLVEALKANIFNVLPMIILGIWTNWTFAGFVTTRVPFPLTLRFKTMLQRGIELRTLDASWVSSASWYFLNAFGLQSIHAQLFSTTENMVEQQTTLDVQLFEDPATVFKREWEELEVTTHHFMLKHAFDDLVAMVCDGDEDMEEIQENWVCDACKEKERILKDIFGGCGDS